ncbi:MAG: choice-of-anchor D domain-containing protein, partial [Bacteriovoracia bacterium]
MQIRKIFGLGLFVLTAGNPLASSAHEGRATCQLGPVDIDQSGVVDVSDLTLVLLNMGAKGHPADVNGDGWVDVDDLMAVILHWGESCALGQFINPPAQYVLQSGVALSFGMNTPPAPAGAYVIFQTWSDAAQAIQAVHTDSAPPFVYPATALNGVTPGSGIMQAIVRSPSHQTLGVISAPAAQFIAPGGPPSAPEITVAIAGSGVSIPNGQVTPIDFGVVNLGAPAPSVVIRVRNDGNAPLTLGSVSVPAGFSMIEGLTASLAPGSNDTFTVQMNTGAPGGYSGQISIANNDADENPFHFAIAGTVQSPPGGGGPSPTGCAIAAAVGGLSGMAPFTVHVNAIHNCNLNAGNITTAQYDWDFGDPTGAFNRISSYGGAHVYEAPGTYTVSVRITNEAGGWVQRTATVNVSANTRARIYVANNGSNANSGASPSDPRATISSVPSNTEVFFRRGDTFGGFTMNGSTNARASAYGTGARPRITGQVTADGTSLMLEEMNFYPSGTINQSIRVTNANGVTIRNNSGQSGGGDYFIEAPLSTARGILVQGNTLGVLGGYLFWGNGSHYSIFGNTLQDSLNQHGVRYYADYVYVIGNDLGNPGNNAISIATSNYSYVAKNILRGDGHDGAWIGYVDDGGPRSAHNVDFEGNLLMNAEVKIHPGDNIVLRNNIIHRGKAYIIG